MFVRVRHIFIRVLCCGGLWPHGAATSIRILAVLGGLWIVLGPRIGVFWFFSSIVKVVFS